MKTGKVILGGIRYRIDVHEGMVTFVESDRMSCARITIQKCQPTGLLYVQASAASGFVPFAHISRAARITEFVLGPNHYTSVGAKHRFERNIAVSRIFTRPLFRVTQRLFWSHEILFRIKSIGWAIQHQWRLWFPEVAPNIEWSELLRPTDRRARRGQE